MRHVLPFLALSFRFLRSARNYHPLSPSSSLSLSLSLLPGQNVPPAIASASTSANSFLHSIRGGFLFRSAKRPSTYPSTDHSRDISRVSDFKREIEFLRTRRIFSILFFVREREREWRITQKRNFLKTVRNFDSPSPCIP